MLVRMMSVEGEHTRVETTDRHLAQQSPASGPIRICVAFLLVLISNLYASAQVDPNLENGIRPYESYAGSQIDRVGLTSGSLSFDIPLFTIPQRGAIQTVVKIMSFRQPWGVVTTCNDVQDTCSAFWALSGPPAGPGVFLDDGTVTIGVTAALIPSGGSTPPNSPCDSDTDPNCNPQQPVGEVTRARPQAKSEQETSVITYTALSLDGSTHPLAGAPGGGMITSDGTGIFCPNCDPTQVVTNPTAYTRDGVYMNNAAYLNGTPQVIRDSNGNSISKQPEWLDTMGRPYISSTTGDGSGTAGCSAAASQANFATYPGPNNPANGAGRVLKTCFTNITVQSAFDAQYYDQYGQWDQVQERSNTVLEQSDVILYDGVSWTKSPKWSFGYDSAGDIASINLPTGAVISYTWIPYGLPCSQYSDSPKGMWLSSRAVTIPGSPTQSDTYSYGPGSTLVSGTSGTVLYTFSNPLPNQTAGPPCNYYETSRKSYSDSSQSQVLEEVDTSYQWVNSFVNTERGFSPTAVNVLPVSRTTILDGVAQGRVEMDYDSMGGGYSYGNIVQEREYDYINGSTTTPTRCTETTYQAFAGANSAAYLANNLIDLPAAKAVYAGACPDGDSTTAPTGNPVAETTCGYDEFALQTWGASAQTAPAARGNQTSINRLQISPAGPAAISHRWYYDTGLPYQSSDPNGNASTFSYSSAYSGAYLTQTLLPPVNGTQQKRSATYDLNTGQVTSYTDQNQQTSYYTYDSLGRIWTAHYPDAGTSQNVLSKAFCYPDLVDVFEYTSTISGSLTAPGTSQSCPTPSTSVLAEYYGFDGLGRSTRTGRSEGSATAWIYTDMSYDQMGLLASISNPYRSTSDPTYGTTAFTYDNIGRKRITTNPDYSTTQLSYSGNQVKYFDESQNTWTRSFDSLGRLIEVMEPGGLETDYRYDALDNLFNVNQHGTTTEMPRTRGFTYDSLSRLIISANRETGTICYGQWSGGSVDSGNCQNGYDANGNLLYKTDNRGLTTQYSYDALNRVIQKVTPVVGSTGGFLSTCYQYDTISGVSGPANLIGHLTAEWTQSGNTCAPSFNPAVASTATIYLSYDPMGRPLLSQQCIKGGCQTGAFTQNQTYDLAGNMTSWQDGRGLMTFSQQFDSAGRPISVTNSISGGGLPLVLFSAQGYTPAGSLMNWNVGDYLNFTRSYDNRLRVTGETVVH